MHRPQCLLWRRKDCDSFWVCVRCFVDLLCLVCVCCSHRELCSPSGRLAVRNMLLMCVAVQLHHTFSCDHVRYRKYKCQITLHGNKTLNSQGNVSVDTLCLHWSGQPHSAQSQQQPWPQEVQYMFLTSEASLIAPRPEKAPNSFFSFTEQALIHTVCYWCLARNVSLAPKWTSLAEACIYFYNGALCPGIPFSLPGFILCRLFPQTNLLMSFFFLRVITSQSSAIGQFCDCTYWISWCSLNIHS